MNIKYSIAMGIRVAGIVLSILSISIAVIHPFWFLLNTFLVDALLILAALLIIIGDLIVISMGTSEEIKNKKQCGEAIYDVITTAVVITLYILFYVVPFMTKYMW